MARSREHLKIKQVVFNVEDPDQLQLLKHTETRPNFSAYIKRLIQRDMDILVPPETQRDKRMDRDIAEGFI